ncbi:MAG: hypothetical protein HY365_01610 [Candidatus Aenigmarchaeota archaeon]|nr:hypothetical protein [Candidatus Aenigmarchaeota archaeon]
MNFEDELAGMLNERKEAISLVRAYVQRSVLAGTSDTAFDTATDEFKDAYHEVFDRGVLCCGPDLFMMADPKYYETYKKELAELNKQFQEGPFASDHSLNIPPNQIRTIRFIGIRGMRFGLAGNGRHIACLEIDPDISIPYFNGLDEAGRERLGRGYIDYLTHTRSLERKHLAEFGQSYVSFVSRKPPSYDFSVGAVIRIK